MTKKGVLQELPMVVQVSLKMAAAPFIAAIGSPDYSSLNPVTMANS